MTVTETNYTTKEILIKNTKWSILIVSGKRNYISIKKITANPYGSSYPGKEFKSFAEAQQYYKNHEMKIALLNLEINN
jgi:hypothetical protein